MYVILPKSGQVTQLTLHRIMKERYEIAEVHVSDKIIISPSINCTNKVIFLIFHLLNLISILKFQDSILLLGVRSKTSHGPRSRFKRALSNQQSLNATKSKLTKIHYVYGKFANTKSYFLNFTSIYLPLSNN